MRGTPFLKQCFVTAAVCFNIIGHGCTLGFPAIVLPQLKTPDTLIYLDTSKASWIASAMAIPMLLGNFLSPPMMDRMGRKMAHFAVAIPVIVGWFSIILARSFEVLFIGRMLHGLSFGLFLPLRSVLIGEYTSPQYRGAFLTMVSLTQSFGIFFVHLIGSFYSWQRTALVCVFFSFISLIMTIYSPESPSYLAAKGKHEKCRKVFRWLRGDEEEKELESMISAQMQVKTENTKEKYFKEISVTLKKKEFYKPILLMVHAYAMVEFAGGTTMASYSPIIITSILGAEANVAFWLILLDGQRIIFNFIAVFVINVCKRRIIIFSIGSISVFTHICISLYIFAKFNGYIVYLPSWLIPYEYCLPILLINLHFFTVATAMVPIPSVIAGEVFPLQYRSIGGSISIISIASATFLVLKTFPSLIESIGIQGTYLVYAGAITYFLLVMFFLLPETKGKTLQQIEDEYRGTPSRVTEDELVKLKDEKMENEKCTLA